jgi:hypothetical protein
MGVRRKHSRVGDTVDVAAARLKRGAHDVLDVVAHAADDVSTQAAAQVTAARRGLADRIDPEPVPRRGLRLLVAGLLLTTVSAVIWAVLAQRSATPTRPHGGPEHLPSTAADDDQPATASTATADDSDEPVHGLTGDPESRTR